MHCSSRATLCTASLAFLASCVSSPIPEGYAGPTATIRPDLDAFRAAGLAG